jgi:hypothetical protein
MRGLGFWLSVCVVNMVLACAAGVLAPREIGTTADRSGYEYVEAQPLAANCPQSIFCYRVLVPAALGHVPAPDVVRWRGFAIAANTLTGILLASLAVAAATTGSLMRPWLPALVASILYQASFGATFAIFDPFTPDAAVYFLAACLAVLWWLDRAWLAMLVAVIGVFVKETIALVMTATALAACVQPRARRARGPWLIGALVAWVVVIGFHVFMDAFAGWTERGSGSADILGGAWLARWLADSTLTTSSRLLYLFIPFGFGWLYAAFGVPGAPRRLQSLALGALLTVPALIYVQTPERALATASFIVIPLAALYLSRAPVLLALAAALTNALLTARVGLSTAWLLPIPYLLILAGSVAALTIVSGALRSRGSSTTLASLRITSSR